MNPDIPALHSDRIPVLRQEDERWRQGKIRPTAVSIGLATLVLLFGFQGEQIIAQPTIIALLAVPILIQVYFAC